MPNLGPRMRGNRKPWASHARCPVHSRVPAHVAQLWQTFNNSHIVNLTLSFKLTPSNAQSDALKQFVCHHHLLPLPVPLPGLRELLLLQSGQFFHGHAAVSKLVRLLLSTLHPVLAINIKTSKRGLVPFELPCVRQPRPSLLGHSRKSPTAPAPL